MNLPSIRTYSQQLLQPQFDTPQALVSWMGAVQAQNYAMSKWAVGIRLKNSTISAIETSLDKGEILRTHVMRPTWHLVDAHDIRWMCELSKKAIKAAAASHDKLLEIDEPLYSKVNALIEKMLAGNHHLTREEIANNLQINGIIVDSGRMVHFMQRAEIEGIVCSGKDKEKKQTYALIDERVPPTKKLNKEEALALLAKKYFQSHSPATVYDFAWWSGLSVTESKNAIALIDNELLKENIDNKCYYIRQSAETQWQAAENVHFLPAFDEYIIAYKYRNTVLATEHQPKAFTKNGIFYPTILHNGKAVGVWNKTQKSKNIEINIDFFEKDFSLDKSLIAAAETRYRFFLST
ncbi:MAG: winged helix DNA-binding domain-containing protein [Prevotellaceae bacterium]|jgi:hypothetical protein|nr:winged helix DNA-binding domain-containing protein [Prevotellaceae bacterium]